MTEADDYRLVAEAARADGRDDVGCVVLGAGADEATVAHWLREDLLVSTGSSASRSAARSSGSR